MSAPPHESAAPVRLCTEALDQLDERVGRPTYDRTRVTTGIVHFGVGGFHRSHQAMYVDQLMNRGQALDWGICGVGLMPGDKAMHDDLLAQDCLYTLMVRHGSGQVEPRVIGSIIDHLYAPDDPEAVLQVMARPNIRVVSLTVTEGGYNIDAVTGHFDSANPVVRADIAAGVGPTTMFGYVVEALRRRRALGVAPFTVVSCDNLEGNGRVARSSILAFAALRDPGLADWIGHEVKFPNSMVDRITPITTPEDVHELLETFEISDARPVVCEPFVQWVLEDDFVTARPPLEEVGVQLTHDVGPYELIKLRLLNASHQAMAYSARLCGYTYAHEAAADPVFAEFLLGYMDEEARPTLENAPGIDPRHYAQVVVERFANPAIRDTISRLCAFSSDRIPKFVLPVIRTNLANGTEVTRGAAIVAGWARYAEGVDEIGQPIDVVDWMRDEIMANARRQYEDPLAFVRNTKIFGDLASDATFARCYEDCLRSFHAVGAHKTLQGINDSLRQRPS